MKKKYNPNKKFTFFLISLAILVFIVIFLRLFKTPLMWDFRNNLYLPVHLLVQQKSPYNIHILVSESNSVWFPMAFGIFFPLGYLDIKFANNIWWLLNFSALFALVWISTGQKKPPILLLASSLIWIFIFPSTSSHFNLGQISILICLILLVIIRYNRRIPDWAIGILLAFSLIKPQLSIFFIPAYFYIIWRERGWQAVLRLAMWTVGGVLFSLLPVILFFPNWLPDFIANMTNNPNWAHPSITNRFFQVSKSFSQWQYWLSLGVGLSVTLLIMRQNYKRSQIQKTNINPEKIAKSLLWVLALTPLFSPYIWSWDFVLIYPLMVNEIFKQQEPPKTILLFVIYLSITGIFISQKISGQFDDIRFWWVPWSLFLFTGLLTTCFQKES